MEKIKSFLKNEPVLIISFFLAVASAFIVKPSSEYLGYIDFRTLALLFCLMAVMAGLNSLGIFKLMAKKLLGGVKSVRGITLVLTLVCFFSSMIITNDVALITFVPFTIAVLNLCNQKGKLVFIVVLETIAANLGSMLTPIGNPQNLFIFSSYGMSMTDFVSAVLPFTLLSLVLLIFCSFFVKNRKILGFEKTSESKLDKTRTVVYLLLFTVSLLTVFKVVPFLITLLITVAAVLIFDKRTLLKIDYSLLLTFVFLFVFIGNLGNISAINDFLKSVVDGNEVISGIVLSQVFSNVPTAILLSEFTNNAKDLLIGVNLGGLGTLIASMASLISFKFVIKEDVKTGKYMLYFTLLNITFLILNLLLRFIALQY